MAGNSPIEDPLILTRGADFVNVWRIADADPDIPDGTTARIVITETNDTDATEIATWSSLTVTAREITARVDREIAGLDDVDPDGDGWRYRLLVTLPDTPDLEHCWYRGSIERQQ